MFLMAALAMPVLERIVAMGGKDVHYEYLLFSYRYWREGTVKDDSRRKCFISIGCVALACAILTFAPLFTLARYTRTVIVGLLLTVVALIFSVVNMYMGMYHFNKSPGADHVGKVNWGPCQTIHIVAAAILLFPAGYLIYEHRKLKKGDVINMAPKSRRALVIVPQILAAILTVAGAATPQALNHDSPKYVTAMRYDIMSFDFTMAYVRDTLVCTPFFVRLVFGTVCTVFAALFAFIAFTTSIFAARRPMVSLISTTIGFCFCMSSVALVGSLIPPIICDDASKNQGTLLFARGSIFLFLALGCSFITTFIAGLSIKLEVNEKDLSSDEGERALLSTEVNNYGA